MLEKTRVYLDSLSKEELKDKLIELGFTFEDNILEDYRGFKAKITECPIDNAYFGKIENISDIVTFQAREFSKFREEFHKAVDDYIEMCKEVRKESELND